MSTVTVTGMVKHVTAAAVLVEVEVAGEKIWFPLSQIVDCDEFTPGEEVECEIPEWLAVAKGIE